MIYRFLLWFLDRRLPDGFGLVSTVIPPDFRVGWYIPMANTCRNYEKLPNWPSFFVTLFFSLYFWIVHVFRLRRRAPPTAMPPLINSPHFPKSISTITDHRCCLRRRSPEFRRHIAPPETLFQSPKVPSWLPWHDELNAADHDCHRRWDRRRRLPKVVGPFDLGQIWSIPFDWPRLFNSLRGYFCDFPTIWLFDQTNWSISY